MKTTNILIIICILLSNKAWSQSPGEDMPTIHEITVNVNTENVIIDGRDNDRVWENVPKHPVTGIAENEMVTDFSQDDFSASYRLCWNSTGLYLFVYVTDEKIIQWEEGWDDYNTDNIEIYLHSGEHPTPEGEYTVNNSFQIRFKPGLTGADNITGRNGKNWESIRDVAGHIDYSWGDRTGGYTLEALIKWDIFANKPDDEVYFEIIVADADNTNDLRESLLMWNNIDEATRQNDLAWNNINYFGKLSLSSTPVFPDENPVVYLTYDNKHVADNCSIDLGYIEAGTEELIYVELKNIGKELLEIKSLDVEGAGFSVISNDISGLSTSEVYEIILKYSGQGEGEYLGTLILETNDPLHNEISLSFTLVEAEPRGKRAFEISVEDHVIDEDSILDFGYLLTGSEKISKNVMVKNWSLSKLKISYLNLDTYNGFSFDSKSSYYLEFGETANILVSFNPVTFNSYREVLNSLELHNSFSDDGVHSLLLKAITVKNTPDIYMYDENWKYVPNNKEFVFSNRSVYHQEFSRTFNLVNMGWKSLKDISLDMQGEGFEAILSGKQIIGFQDTAQLIISFNPVGEGWNKSHLTLKSDSPEGRYSLILKGYVIMAGDDPSALVFKGMKLFDDEEDVLNFGNVSRNHGMEQLFLIIKNAGMDTLNVWANDYYGAFDVYIPYNDSEKCSLAQDEEELIVFTFYPEQLGLYSDTLKIYTNDPNQSEINFYVFGSGVNQYPTLLLSSSGDLLKNKKDTVYFGTANQVVTHITKELNISNAGLEPLKPSIQLNGDNFMIEPYWEPIYRLNCNESLPLKIRYNPDKNGISYGSLEIRSNDPFEGDYKIFLKGECINLVESSLKVAKDINAEVYPNPARSFIAINSTTELPLNVEIFTLENHKVFSKAVPSKERIDISMLNSGIYVIRIETGRAYVFKKLVVH